MGRTIKVYMLKERLRCFGRGVAALLLALIGYLGSFNTISDFMDGRMRFSVMEIGLTTLFVLMFIGFGWCAARLFYRVIFIRSGTLTQSVLSQRIDRKQKAAEIFAEIEVDLAPNAVTFGKLRIGNNWVMGDEAMRLNRVCGIFTEKRYVVIGQLRIIYNHLYLLDKNNNLQCNLMTDESELDDAAEYLSGRLPNAFVGDITDSLLLMSKSGEELLEYLSEVQPPTLAVAAACAQPFNFIGTDGVPTSNFTWNDVQTALYSLRVGESVGFEFLSPIKLPNWKAKSLFCRAEERGRMTLLLCTNRNGSYHWSSRANVGREEAVAFMEGCYSQKEVSFVGFTSET